MHKLIEQTSFHKRSNFRKERGVSYVFLILVIAFFAILPLGLLGFEFARYVLIMQQLRNVTDAAALAGGAALTSAKPGLSAKQLHEIAMQVAIETFERNSILTTGFSSANLETHANTEPGIAPKVPNHAVLNISLLDDHGDKQQTGSSRVRRIRCEAIFTGLTAFSSSILPIQKEIVANAESDAGLPKLDVFICYDCSGSMDDQTPVILARKYWSSKTLSLEYAIVADGTMSQVFAPTVGGTAVNCGWPQNLSYASESGADGNNNTFIWSEANNPSPNKIRALRCGVPSNKWKPAYGQWGAITGRIPEQALLPGNFNPKNPKDDHNGQIVQDAYGNGFTDLIVKVPDVEGYPFPNYAVCLEASRGNLENGQLFKKAMFGRINPLLRGIVPTPGYYSAYWHQVEKTMSPAAQAREAAKKFIDTMSANSDVHFGFAAFTDVVGETEEDIWKETQNKIDPYWDAGGWIRFPLPKIELEQREANGEKIVAAIDGSGPSVDALSAGYQPPLGALGATDLSAVLYEAIDELSRDKCVRPQSKRVIVLFTDGIPNAPGGEGPGRAAAIQAAQSAKKHGIPIFTIGLSQNRAVKPLEDALLGDDRNGSGKGLAYLSGNHGRYLAVTDPDKISDAFQSVARILSVLKF